MPDDEWGIAVVVKFDLGRKFAGSFLLSEIDKRRLIAQPSTPKSVLPFHRLLAWKGNRWSSYLFLFECV